ncbi:uncharacterized protein LOC128658209 [Bombina bombina]|uniref:uncharacterized protein LOC128658209 n=1 Tax=Bombina bombina TaxID=8345 RepID=UPI00235B2127|nr:uncharacterized protein LOC128658209 [Bombina bombina]
MSQGIMRKSQPFTIGTKLSQTKCPDFSVAGCDVTALESCSHRLSDRVSQYLALTSLPPRSILSAHHPVRDLSEDERFSQGSLVRSIKKITLSSHSGEAHSKGTERLSARGVNLNSVANYNNNNSRMLRNVASDFIVSPSTCSVQNNLARTNGGPSYLSRSIGNPSNNMFNVGPKNYTPRATDMSNHIPRANGDPSNIVSDIGSPNKIVGDIVGPTNIVRDIGCPINLALRTDEVQSNQQVKSNVTSLTGCPGSYPLLDSMARVIEEQNKKTPQMKVPGSPSLTRIFRKRLDSTGGKKYLLENTAPYITELSREITQAETWVRGKLHDLADRCDTSPLQDWEQGTLTLLSDIRAYEHTIMRLTQMGENLTKSQTPSAETVQTQLQTLRDQWLLLKQTATNQSKALSGAKTLQEFNKKADELEMWMREKEERPSLNHLLDESNDKVQLTRRILDLKQEQVHYRNLQENINSLAQKLEKHGRAESKGTSTRRKHLNKMWLKLQDTLQEHQQTLQLALDAASLWQQSDTILRAIEDKMNMATAVNGEDSEKHKTRDIRDIAGQIMILDLTVSQVSSLHPILAIRAAQKQCQVKESWAQLQQALR